MGRSKNARTLSIIGAASFAEFKEDWLEKIDEWNLAYPNDPITDQDAEMNHIKPISAFSPGKWPHPDPLAAHHMTNLQPTSERVNRGLKNDKWSDDDEEYWKQNIYKQDERREIYLPKDCKYVPP